MRLMQWRPITMALVTGALFLGLGLAGANATVRVKLSLVRTAKAPARAKGLTKLVLKPGAKGKFGVTARRLAPFTTYDVIVRGVKLGTLTTNAGGTGKAKFSSTPRPNETLLGVDPRGDQVVVRDEDTGDDELVGDEPAGDSAMGACCIATSGRDGESESECEELSAADCTTAGGTPNAAGSCLPDPCATTPPAEDILCCLSGSAQGGFIEEDPDVECEDVSTPAQCAAQGGTVVAGTSCDASPCAPTPPGSIVACCVPDGNETECEELTPESCTAHNGTASAASSCDGNPCGGGSGGGGGGDD